MIDIEKSSYDIYNEKYHKKKKINLLDELFPSLPNKKYSIIYADPPWDYNGKMQFDKTGMSENNKGWNKDIFISSASFKYPTVKTNLLKTLNVRSIADEDCLLFMWSTNPHLAQAIELGNAWGFEYKTIAFIWDKMVHNPGQYTLSYCEVCLLFKKGRIPRPRGARNIKQLFQEKRSLHSKKPTIVSDNIEKMFPTQDKIELFAREKKVNWDVWGLESLRLNSKNSITSQESSSDCTQNDQLSLLA